MIRFSFILSVMALAGLACAGPAAAAERKFVVSAFEAVQIEGDIAVDLTNGISPSARAEGARRDLDRVRLVRNGTLLIVRMVRPLVGSAGTSGPVRLELSTRRLDTVTLRGGGRVAVNAIDAQRARLSLSGAGSLTVGRLAADTLDLSLDGAGKLSLAEGSVGIARVRVEGSGALDAPGFTARSLELAQTGAASSRIAASGSAQLSVNGTGSVAVGGTAKCEIRERGAATISCG